MTKSKAQKKRAKGGRKGPQSSVVARAVQAAINKPKRKRNRKKRGGGSYGMNPQQNNRLMSPGAVYQGKPLIVNIPYREEFINSFSTAVAFTNSDYIINPGSVVTFPWLSKVASHFEEYRFRSLAFKFVSTSATALASTNTALGSVIMNTNYDVADVAFTSQSQMENYGGVTEAAPSVSTVHVVEANGRKGGISMEGSAVTRYLLTSSSNAPTYPSSTSAHDYDVGRFQIASSGAQAASVAGRLYVCYSVDLIRAKTETPIGQSLLAGHYTGTATTSNSFTAATARSGSNLAPTYGAATFTIPFVGRYFTMWSGLAATSIAGATFSAGTGAADVNWFTSESGGNDATAGSTTAAFIAAAVIDCTTPGAVITFTIGAIVGACVWDHVLIQIPGALALPVGREDRLTMLENMVKSLCVSKRSGSLTDDDDWKCRTEDMTKEERIRFSQAESKSSSSKSPSLSDSVVDLITAKLRK